MPHFFNHQFPLFIYLITDNKEFWVNIILATITLLAVLVGLFQEKIKSFFTMAKLKVSINLAPPDCHQIVITSPDGRVGIKSLYFRIRIDHLTGSPAENVEVIISRFWKFNMEDEKQILSKFLPMNLVWSHFQPRTHTIKIPKMMFRHCDLGYMINLHGDTVLKLDTITQPNPVADGESPNIIDPGKYEFELLVSGDNTIPIKKRWSLEFDGTWTENEKEMLGKYVKIKEINII